MDGDNPRVVIVDDHTVMAETLATALRLQELDVVGVFSGDAIDDADIVALVNDKTVVLLDLQLEDRLSIPLIAPLVERGACVLVITAASDRALLGACLEAGAAGVFNKSQPFDHLFEMLLDAASGRAVMSAAARSVLLESLRRERAAEGRTFVAFDALSAREVEVLRGLMDGSSADELARDLHVAVSTVRSHVKAILRKLGVNSQLAAVALAHSVGWDGSRRS